MKRPIILIIVLCAMLGSCAKNVSPIEKRSETEKVSLLDYDSEYVTVDQLEEHYPKIFDEKYNHLTFRDNVRFDPCGIKELDHLYLKQRKSFLFEKEKDIISFLNKGSYPTDEVLISYDEIEGYDPVERHQMNPDGYPYYTLYDGGSMVWLADSVTDGFLENDEDENTEEVIFCCNEPNDKKYKLTDCEMSINEAIEICNEFIEKLRGYGYPELSLHDIKVRKQNDYYAFEIDLSETYNGIPLRGTHDGRGNMNSSEKDVYHGKLSNIKCNPYGYTVLICSSTGVTFFLNNEQVFDIYDKTKIETVMTPESALRFIDNNLGDQSAYEVEYFGMQYKTYYVDPETNIYDSHPFWCASLYSPAEDKYYFALVDCETGDFSFYEQ